MRVVNSPPFGCPLTLTVHPQFCVETLKAFDFIFFDWDMYFLSLMAGTLPAAADSAAFDIAISNLIGVTQTRSSYGLVMNKRHVPFFNRTSRNGIRMIHFGRLEASLHGGLIPTLLGVHFHISVSFYSATLQMFHCQCRAASLALTSSRHEP
jgi:hypothetical protein